ncbi:hypothetical protein NDU88_001564 [Pleurodeles waltl]|uniref:Uncharacterized protein n=1 Tax=Pleurodeles waltl TaxID=8319 RepID=A0AAV7KRT4_PLEWA|nr:hypothetical protein NDU88_001564 [Pleurodeles waltl]
MTGGKSARGAHQTKLDRFSLPCDATGEVGMGEVQGSVALPPPENYTLTLKDIIAVIQGVRDSLETKIDIVSTDTMLEKAGLSNMSARVKEAEDSLTILRAETLVLKKQVKELRTTYDVLGAKLVFRRKLKDSEEVAYFEVVADDFMN